MHELPFGQAPTTVCALYKFVSLPDYQKLKAPLLGELERLQIRGTLLLAAEGINGTISGAAAAIDSFLQALQQDPRFADIDCKYSEHDESPFHRTKVKLKQEIVTMGVDGIDPNTQAGTYVDASDWNALISDSDTLLIDTRNEYEVGIGSFKGAVNPHTESFRDFPDYVEQNLDSSRHRRVAMFCTGGIRCEKASSLLKTQGFEEVFHLKGGILKYLETVDREDSLWQGECFVFDDRVAVGHDLEKGSYEQCHACRYPITTADQESSQYVPGVSCPRCFDSLTEEQKERFGEREKQVQLAKQRGDKHIGSEAREAAARNREQKQAAKARQKD